MQLADRVGVEVITAVIMVITGTEIAEITEITAVAPAEITAAGARAAVAGFREWSCSLTVCKTATSFSSEIYSAVV